METATIYPHVPRNDWDGSLHILGAIAKKHNVDLISIGNGTASRETDKLAADLMKRHPELKLTRIVVSEAGASVVFGLRTGLARVAGPRRDSARRGVYCTAPAGSVG